MMQVMSHTEAPDSQKEEVEQEQEGPAGAATAGRSELKKTS